MRATECWWPDMESPVEKLYVGKECLAPMVRAGTLPLRSLALRYGADTVWGEEIIDRRITQTVRQINDTLETVDYTSKDGRTVVLRTHPASEGGRFVYQIGTANSTYALNAALHVQQDVSAVDVNMGCPKNFSTGGGMGAALLSTPELSEDILKTLRRNLAVPVSCKIRLLADTAATVEYARRMEAAGAQALTVHARRVGAAERDRALWEELRPVVDAVGVPVVANGDCYTRGMMAEVRRRSGCASVMLARPALYNASLFDKAAAAPAPRARVIREYVQECIRFDNNIQNSKYNVMEMMRSSRHPEYLMNSILDVSLPSSLPDFQAVSRCKTMEKLAGLYGLSMVYQEAVAKWDNGKSEASRVGHKEKTNPVCIRATEPARRYSDSYFKAELDGMMTKTRQAVVSSDVAEKKNTNTENCSSDEHMLKKDSLPNLFLNSASELHQEKKKRPRMETDLKVKNTEHLSAPS